MLCGQCPDMSASYNWVDTEVQLEQLARLLSEERAFAVDTEQHSIRSFLGYTALIQVYLVASPLIVFYILIC
jgi:cobalt/nickel-transporting P-type ATPase D